MWNPALQDPAQIQRACAPNCGGQGMAEAGSAPLMHTVHAAQTQLVRLGDQLHRLLQLVWLDLHHAVEATRLLAAACRLWLRHMTPDTTHRLGTAALHWLAAPAVQHVLMGSVALLLLLSLLFGRKPQPARPTRAASSIASTARAAKPRRARGWQTAAMGAAAGGAAVAATAAFADSFDQDTWRDHDQNLGDDAFPGGLHSSFADDDFADVNFGTADSGAFSTGSCVNPANGLPMMGEGCGGMDIMGNAYGTDSNDSFSSSWSDDSFSSNTWSSDDSWSTSSSWDDHSTSSSSWD